MAPAIVLLRQRPGLLIFPSPLSALAELSAVFFEELIWNGAPRRCPRVRSCAAYRPRRTAAFHSPMDSGFHSPGWFTPPGIYLFICIIISSLKQCSQRAHRILQKKKPYSSSFSHSNTPPPPPPSLPLSPPPSPPSLRRCFHLCHRINHF